MVKTFDNFNPVLSTSCAFDFHAVHNGIHCIASMDPKDAGTKRAFWFSAKMLCETYDVADQTLRDNIQSLRDDGELGLPDISGRRINIEDAHGVPHPTTIYNLEVLNKLGMCCFRGNKRAKAVRNAFNDVLIKHETAATVPQTYLDALKALVASEEAKEAAQKALIAEQKALIAEKEEHERDNADFQAGLDILNSQKAEISSRREAEALGRLSNIAMREKLASYTENLCKKQLGILRDGRYRAEQLLGTKWMMNCIRKDAYKDLKKWLASMASRRVTARLSSELDMESGDASTLRECYMRAKMYGMDFDDLCEVHGFLDVRDAYRVLSSCVAVVDRYECTKGNGESKICPVCGYTPEIWGEVLHALIESPKIETWLRDDTPIEDFAWLVTQKSGENYGLPVE